MTEKWSEDFHAENRMQRTVDVDCVWGVTFALHYRELRSRFGPEKRALIAGVAADEARAACLAEIARRHDDSQ